MKYLKNWIQNMFVIDLRAINVSIKSYTRVSKELSRNLRRTNEEIKDNNTMVRCDAVLDYYLRGDNKPITIEIHPSPECGRKMIISINGKKDSTLSVYHGFNIHEFIVQVINNSK